MFPVQEHWLYVHRAAFCNIVIYCAAILHSTEPVMYEKSIQYNHILRVLFNKFLVWSIKKYINQLSVI